MGEWEAKWLELVASLRDLRDLAFEQARRNSPRAHGRRGSARYIADLIARNGELGELAKSTVSSILNGRYFQGERPRALEPGHVIVLVRTFYFVMRGELPDADRRIWRDKVYQVNRLRELHFGFGAEPETRTEKEPEAVIRVEARVGGDSAEEVLDGELVEDAPPALAELEFASDRAERLPVALDNVYRRLAGRELLPATPDSAREVPRRAVLTGGVLAIAAAGAAGVTWWLSRRGEAVDPRSSTPSEPAKAEPGYWMESHAPYLGHRGQVVDTLFAIEGSGWAIMASSTAGEEEISRPVHTWELGGRMINDRVGAELAIQESGRPRTYFGTLANQQAVLFFQDQTGKFNSTITVLNAETGSVVRDLWISGTDLQTPRFMHITGRAAVMTTDLVIGKRSHGDWEVRDVVNGKRLGGGAELLDANSAGGVLMVGGQPYLPVEPVNTQGESSGTLVIVDLVNGETVPLDLGVPPSYDLELTGITLGGQRLIAFVARSGITVLDFQTGDVIAQLPTGGGAYRLTSLATYDDGPRYLVAMTDHRAVELAETTIRAWNTGNWKEIPPLVLPSPVTTWTTVREDDADILALAVKGEGVHSWRISPH